MTSHVWRCIFAAALVVGLSFLAPGGGLLAGDDEQQGQNDNEQQGQNDDGQQNQKDDGQKNQKDDGQQGQNDDGQKNQKDDGQQNQGVFEAVNAAGDAVTVVVQREGKDIEQTFDLPKDVPVVIAGKSAKLADLKAGMRVALKLSKDRKVVVRIKAV